MRERCPNCGNYWTESVARPHNLWIVLTTYWMVAWLIAALLGVSLTVWAVQGLGFAEGWSVALLPAAALIVGIAPRLVVRRANERRIRSSSRRFCRSCGYEWDVP